MPSHAAPKGGAGGKSVSRFEVRDIVAVSRQSFSQGIRSAVKEAWAALGNRLESVEIAPPLNVVLTEYGEVESRNTVRLIVRSDD